MSSPVPLTEWLGAIGGVAGAAAVAWQVRAQSRKDKRNDERDHDASDVASWSKLNASLDREIARLNAEMERQRKDYEERLQLANRRISDLTAQLEALRQAIRNEPPG